MLKVTLVTGGARSGKSSFAEAIYNEEKEVVYIATSKIYDEEMRDRVKLHRERRPNAWRTFEGYENLSEAVEKEKNYILDCLTIMTSNIMFDITKDREKIPRELQKKVEDMVIEEIKNLISAVSKVEGQLVIVTNEVGSSIVPENHVARVYRDIIGKVNQRVAAISQNVYLVTCGIPLKVK